MATAERWRGSAGGGGKPGAGRDGDGRPDDGDGRPGGEHGELAPIDVVARRLGLRASAIRYYEERGLIEPAFRRAGRRWYGPREVRRLAVIRYWQETGLMSLEEIAEILAGPAAGGGRGREGEGGRGREGEGGRGPGRWRAVVEGRAAALGAQIERMQGAKAVLEHILAEHAASPGGSIDGCPHYEAHIWNRELRLDHHAQHR
ncbi:MAG TPA: MerR family transcriptional regulator [Acidimicrobiales bacterium]|nr:MerR family transcriptional regulator [Acidimicrobiales bacterium]